MVVSPLHTTHDDTQCTAAYREPNNDDLEQLGNTDTIFHATLPLPALLTRLGFIPVPSPCFLFAELCLLQMSWHYWAWPVFVSHAAHTMSASLFRLKKHASIMMPHNLTATSDIHTHDERHSAILTTCHRVHNLDFFATDSRRVSLFLFVSVYFLTPVVTTAR